MAAEQYGTPGDDTLEGGPLRDVLYGGAGNDKLYGGAGNDQLSGGLGDDYMAGGDGNDTYYVDSRKDVTYEKPNEGIDTVVFTGYSDEGGKGGYTLKANFEVLRLQGEAGSNLSGNGNELDNSIQGDAYNNNLFGGAGNDSLYGYDGNDIIRGGSGNDIMDGGNGIDTVSYKDFVTAGTTGVTVSLAITGNQNTGDGIDKLSNFENLEGSNYNDQLTGDSAANVLHGLAGDDVIRGGGGADTLVGGAGSDQFVFEAAASNGLDIIQDFTAGVDKLVFSSADYGSGTFSQAGNVLSYDGVDIAVFKNGYVFNNADVVLV